MVLENSSTVLFYRYGKFFNRKRGHTTERLCKTRIPDLRTHRFIPTSRAGRADLLRGSGRVIHCRAGTPIADRSVCRGTSPRAYRLASSINPGPKSASNGSRRAAAHVEGEEFFHVFDLASAGLFGELLIGVENLAHPGRADRMAVGDQTAAGVYRNFEWKFAALLITNLRQRSSRRF